MDPRHDELPRLHDLRWSEIDPRTHPFDPATARAEVGALAPAARVPPLPEGTDMWDRIEWGREVAGPWTGEMTRALYERFGPWVVGWQYSADGDGGAVFSWCCPGDSVSTPEVTLDRVAASLCEWRAWLEELGEIYERHPMGSGDRADVWERAAAVITTRVVERTQGSEAWYMHCAQALTWYLSMWGVSLDTAVEWTELILEGSFESWIVPEDSAVREVARQVAAAPWEKEGRA